VLTRYNFHFMPFGSQIGDETKWMCNTNGNAGDHKNWKILTLERRSSDCFILKPRLYRAVNTFHRGYKNQSVFVIGAKVAICSEINIKHTNTVWKNVKFLNTKPAGASRNL